MRLSRLSARKSVEFSRRSANRQIDLDVFLDRHHINMKNTLSEFLQKHAAPKGSPFTHTRIGSKSLGIAGGCYCIPASDREEFYKLYTEHLDAGRFEYLTEVQGEVGPLLVDLDFRYDVDVEERQHTPGLREDLVALYCEAISATVDLENETNLTVYAFEKPHVNCCESQTKDGIHLVFDIALDRATQCLVRDYVKGELENVVGSLDLTNSLDDVLDEGITLGRTNWQLFGSRKPGNEAYELSSTSVWRTEDGSLELEKTVLAPEVTAELHTNVSAQMFVESDVESVPIVEGVQPAYDTWVGRLTKPGKPSAGPNLALDIPAHIDEDAGSHNEMPTGGATSPQDVVAMAMEYISKTLDRPEAYHLREVAEYAMCLNAEYYDDRTKWFQVGLALHSTHKCLFGVWMGFSAKSSKFDVSDITSYKDDWDRMGVKQWNAPPGKTLTCRSIMYWARTSNPEAFYSINSQCVSHYMEETLRGAAEYDIAQVMFCKYKALYKCVSIKNRTWYQYVGHRWTECDGGVGLRNKISAWLAMEYLKKTQQIVNQTLQHSGESEESAALQKRASKYSEIALLLKKTTYKDHVMRECCELFYDPKFLDQLDTNPHLLCFENGIYDFEEKMFRSGRADDYVSLTTGMNYIPDSAIDPALRRDAETFMEQLFPDHELREYMWDHLAAVLPGMNDNQTFNIYSGIGSNGKSKLVELMDLCLGDYKGTVPITMVVGRRTNIGSASPEIAQLKGKRYAVMQEPTKGDKINEGILKEMTGSDPIQGRALYKDTVTYVPQFTLVVCCNDLPTFKSNDEGTWRRVRLCRFGACFVDPAEEDEKRKENPNVKYWWPKDKQLGQKLKVWAPTFMSLLVARVRVTDGNVRECDAVMRESKQYRNDQDVLVLFRQERIREAHGEWLNITVVWNDFQEWFREAYPGRRAMPERKELRASLEKALGATTHTRGWKNWTSGPVGVDEDYDE